ncbi:MAG: septal ring lytic transglycosylase RlpA family protein [Verrucomicrobiae bacterium]|nr:septal ring lytic transglycosylase RlpA family protein [Verrucomicrobiae bacterium]NNJ86892.1 septal ring lytic transglycosylase RlpA family protein [Akkermansiaceae bacterium]
MIRIILIILPVMVLAACSIEKPESHKKDGPPAKAIATQHGLASWYNTKTNRGTKTASGRPLRNHAYTAAHKHWPMGSKVRVTCKFNGKSEILTITDRGPYVKGRIIDVTIGSAKRLGFHPRGITKVKVELLERGNWKYRHP